jgi:dethiobiotin synthetase
VTEPRRPARLVVVTGTGTDVGKTWWAAALARELRARGRTVAARKPVQSYARDDPRRGLDAAVLAAATGETPEDVCPAHRWLPSPMAPPIAAHALGLRPFTVAELVAEIQWPATLHLGFVEGVGGLRSPLADDGDTRALVDALQPDDVLVVARAGLGAIHDVRVVVDALAGSTVTVALNRFDAGDDLHRRNLEWLTERDRLVVATDPTDLAAGWA